jgi:hypothetical protein
MSQHRRSVAHMQAIIGSEELAAGTLTRGQLRWRYEAAFPGVYLPKEAQRTVAETAQAAWLWSRRSGVVAGRTAAALHGVSWADVTAPVELIASKRNTTPGLLVRNERLTDDEVRRLECGLPVTTPARTALDLARHWPRDIAVEHLDALAAATGVSLIEILNLSHRYRGAAGIAHSREALRLMDGGAASVRETTLRLAMVDAGFPRPATQILVSDGAQATIVSIGWERYRIGLTYADFDQTVPGHPWHELARSNFLQLQGWINLYVLEEHSLRTTARRVREAFRVQRQRGL